MRYGALSEFTKTEAGRRDIPMSPMLREMLLAWRVRCPRKDGQLERVFPAPGTPARLASAARGRRRAARLWQLSGALLGPTLKRLGLPPVTPHSARHSFISTLQAQGVEVGLVAKLAGHKSAVVTLSHYTHAMRGGEDAVKALDRLMRGARREGASDRERKREAGGGAGGVAFHERPARGRVVARSVWRSNCPKHRADRAAKGKASAIEEALRILGRGGGADREREPQ